MPFAKLSGRKKNLPWVCFFILFLLSGNIKKQIALKSLNHKIEGIQIAMTYKRNQGDNSEVSIDCHELNAFAMPLTMSTYAKLQGRSSYP